MIPIKILKKKDTHTMMILLQGQIKPHPQGREMQQQLLQQVDRTNKVLEEITRPNWFQRTVLGKK